ncbi:hypothetical protein PA598K_03938 [Paenibacillus sp. 598K]|uniref:extracellular solute-binding protein n=1 Tax=Paenibacillus sp. 598K TaxID=1117987 RepID=UPI000FF991A2|nr:extracellular solute-binding protein [Paenibacillus sp. 598K]GBF75522.1 hypothetical protein PA598K_03938 [Paenibacillus sp. 598K]
MNKTTSAAICCILVLLTVSGCYSSRPQPQVAEPDTAATLTTIFSLRPSLSFKNGETIEDNVHTRFVREQLGVDIRYLWTAPDSTFTTKLKLQLINKRELPDIITVRTSIVHELIDSGRFMPVDEVFERYASPVWKNAMAEDPAVWSPYARDGQHYAIPILDYAYNSDPMMWIRTDWLERLGLRLPTNLEQLETVLDAFTHQDPDGNGLHDTYGIAVSLQRQVNTWMADISWVFGMYGVLPGQWNAAAPDAADEAQAPRQAYVYGSVQEQTRQGLEKIKQWRDAGYFSDEAIWQDEETAARLFTEGKAGIVIGPNWMRYWPLAEMDDSGSAARFQAIPLPAGPGGTTLHWSTPPSNGAILINKDIKDPEPFFRYINYLYDHQGLRKDHYAYGMAKDYDYTEIDGKPTTDRSLIPGGYVDVSGYTLIYDGARIPSSWESMVHELDKPILIEQAPYRLANAYQGPPTATMKERWDQLVQTEHEAFVQIIFGKKPLSYFDTFVAGWQRNGGDRIGEEINAWFREEERRPGAR